MVAELVPAGDGRLASSEARLAALEAKVARAVVRARAPSTLRAYRSEWADFALWCDQIGASALPAAPGVVAALVGDPVTQRLVLSAQLLDQGQRLSELLRGRRSCHVDGRPKVAPRVVDLRADRARGPERLQEIDRS